MLVASTVASKQRGSGSDLGSGISVRAEGVCAWQWIDELCRLFSLSSSVLTHHWYKVGQGGCSRCEPECLFGIFFSMQARHYYQIIKRPMDLSVIRAKLNKRNKRHYNSPDQFVADMYLMFRNCAKFNYVSLKQAQFVSHFC